MPVFELEGPDGKTYEVDAPDQASAIGAFKKMTGGPDTRANPLGRVDAFMRGAADTAMFGFADETAAGAGALLGQGDYGTNVARERATDESDTQNRFWERTAGQVAGTVPLLFVPGIGWMRAANIAARVAKGALGGAAIGAGYGLGSGEGTPQERLPSAIEGGVIGGTTGAAIPIAGKAVSKVASALMNRGAPNRAASVAARALTDDRITPQNIIPEMNALGPEAILADLGPNAQRQAGALASVPGRAQSIVRDTLEARNAGANMRIRGGIDQTIGPAPIPSQIDQALVGQQRALSPAYEGALNGARAVDTSDIALTLDSASVALRGSAQKAAQAVRKMLNVVGTDQLDPNPRTLLETRHAIDGMLTTEADPNTIRILTVTRKAVDAKLAQAAPNIKAVDAQFADLAKQREAVTRGQQVLDSGREAPRPVELADEMAAASPGVALRSSQGTRAEIERVVGTNTNDVVALNKLIKGEGSWNRDRLVTQFGAQKADRIIQILDNEKRMAETGQVVMRNSETAARGQAQREIVPRIPGDTPRGLTVLDLAMKPVDWARRQAVAARGAATNEELARILTTKAYSPEVKRVAEAMLRRRKAERIGSAAGNALLPVGRGLVVPQLIESSPY